MADFFVVNRWFLKLGALWKPDSKNRVIHFFYQAYALGTFLFVHLFFTTTELISLMQTYKNKYDLIKNVNFALTHLVGTLKVLLFHHNSDKLKQIMMELENPDAKYEICSAQKFEPINILKQYKKDGIIYSMGFFLLAHATLIMSYLPPAIAAFIYILQDEEKQNKYLPKKLPYYCWMPFPFDTPETLLIALGYQAVPMFSFCYGIVGMDTLFMNLMNGVTMNLEIIQGALLTLNQRVIKRNQSIQFKEYALYDSKMNKILNIEMKKICMHLQRIYRICDELENLYKYQNLAQSLATLFILCTCLYLVSTTPINSKQFYAEIAYMVTMGFQFILYCSFGNELTLKAADIPTMIWQNDWLLNNKDFKIAMIVTMARNNKPFYLTAGKFVPLTLSTFLTVIKASYSSYAVLKSTNK